MGVRQFLVCADESHNCCREAWRGGFFRGEFDISRSTGAVERPYDAQGTSAPGQTLTGIDVLEQDNFAELAGKHVGLITNQTGVDRNGRSTIDLLAHAPNETCGAV